LEKRSAKPKIAWWRCSRTDMASVCLAAGGRVAELDRVVTEIERLAGLAV